MSIKTEESLNCPCNGIYKCGLHSIPKFLPFPKINNCEQLYNLVKEFSHPGTPPHFISPSVNVSQRIKNWEPLYIAIVKKKEFD